MNDAAENGAPTSVECRPTRDPAIRWFIFAAMLMGFSIWCLTDRRAVPEAWDMKHINDIAAYLLNNWGPALFLPLGLIALILGVRQLTRRLTADQTGIRYGGLTVTWDQVTTLDTSQLQEKKILDVIYGDGKVLRLDSWKLENFLELVKLIEANVSLDKPSQPESTGDEE